MTALMRYGAEMQTISLIAEDPGWSTASSGAPFSIDTSVVNTGSGLASLKMTIAAGFAVASWAFTSVITRTYYSRARVYIHSGTMTHSINQGCVFLTDNLGNGAQATLVSDGSGNITLSLYDYQTNTLIATGVSLSVDAWHNIELSWNQTTGAAVVKLDGTTAASGTANTSSSTSCAFTVGFTNNIGTTGTITINFDDCGVNDDQGSSCNTYLGASQLVMLFVTATSTNTGWTAGHSGDGLPACVSQLPPKGTVATDTTTVNSKIKDATSNTTDNYQATMTTYTAAGIASGSTIVSLYALANHGNSVATARLGGISGVSNPAVTEVTGNTPAAIAGTFPSNWNTIKTGFAYSPTVTLSTAPVLKYRKGTASTNTSMVDFIGMYVEYLPPVTIPLVAAGIAVTTVAGGSSETTKDVMVASAATVTTTTSALVGRVPLTASGIVIATAAISVIPFPSAPIIDTGIRANESPWSNGGKISGPTYAGDDVWQIVSNQIVGTTGVFPDGYYNAATFVDSEAYATITTGSATATPTLMLRLQGAGGTPTAGYYSIFEVGDTFVGIFDAVTFAQYGPNGVLPQALAAGDSIGMRMVGSVITMWWKPAGGVWQLVMTVSDSTYTAAGNIGILNNANGIPFTFNNFGGGLFGGRGIATDVLSDTVVISTTVTGALTVRDGMTASAAIVTTTAAPLFDAPQLVAAGIFSTTSVGSPAIRDSVIMTASAAVVTVVTDTLADIDTLASTAFAIATTAGATAPSVSVAMVASAAIVTTITDTLVDVGVVSGAAVVTTTTTGALSVSEPLAGSLAITTTVAGLIVSSVAGSAAITTGAVGTLSISVAMAGEADAVIATTAALVPVDVLNGSAAVITTASNPFSGLNSAFAVTTTTTATLHESVNAAASTSVVSTAAGTLTLTAACTAAAAVVTSTSATESVNLPLNSTINLVTSFTDGLLPGIALSGQAQISTTSTGTETTIHFYDGVIVIHTTANGGLTPRISGTGEIDIVTSVGGSVVKFWTPGVLDTVTTGAVVDTTVTLTQPESTVVTGDVLETRIINAL